MRYKSGLQAAALPGIDGWLEGQAGGHPPDDREAVSLEVRRGCIAALATGVTTGLLTLGAHVLAADGVTIWTILIGLCLAATAPWLGLTAATGFIGLWLRLTMPDPAESLDGRPAEAPITVRTVVAVCVRLEDMEAVLPPLDCLLRDVVGDGDRFALAILSDTPDGAMAEQERTAVDGLIARHPAGAVRYRRRAENVGFKAGNVMEFLDWHAAGFDFMLILDADSLMSAMTVRRLVRIMQADPDLAVLQPTVAGHGAGSVFTRLFGFGHRHSVRIWATGQNWWQGPEGPYWGHNALVRIAAFRAHCRLPSLPDGSLILSHDHVEAALLHGAGWAVRVLPDDTGSAEKHPPDLVALLDRDARWAAGNMQYRHLLRRRNLGRVGRFQMLQAILHYALAPLWFGLLPLAAVNAVLGDGRTPRAALLALLVTGFLALNLPKLAGYAEAILRCGGGRARLLGRMGTELVFAALVDSVAALDRTVMVLRLSLGRRGGWVPQRREALGVSWSAAARRFGLHTVVGILLLLAFGRAGWFALVLALPAMAGLLLSIPLCVLTAPPAAARRRPNPGT